MSVPADLSYAGICSRIRDGSTFFEVRAQVDSSELRDITGSSHKLFPPTGEVEWKSPTHGMYAPGDWAAFEVASQGSPGQKKFFRAIDARPLLLVEDLSQLGSVEAVRRLLVEDGRSSDRAGDKIFRISATEIVRVQLSQSPDGKWRASDEQALRRLPVFLFDSQICLNTVSAGRVIVLCDSNQALQQIGNLNWSRDADVIRRIVKLLLRNEDADDRSLRQFADALNKYADSLESGSSSSDSIDLQAAREILRVRNLAQMMRDEQDILASYFETLRHSPEVQALVDGRIAEIAASFLETEKARISKSAQAQLDAEFADRRALNEGELRKSIDDLSVEMTAELEANMVARQKEIETQISELERQGIESLEQSLGERKAALADDVSDLESRRDSTAAEFDRLQQAKEAVESSLSELKAKESQAIETVERLTGLAGKAERASRWASRADAALPQVQTPPASAAKIRLSEVQSQLSSSPLLTPKGKSTVVRLAVLFAAGEVPLLAGPECNDFLAIVEHQLFGGRSRSLEADPTIITFDDLWIRPGTRTATPLKEAATELEDGAAPQFCVIRRADRSGAQFWYPALADRAHRGELPRNLFICATLAERNSDEAKLIIPGAIILDMTGVLAPMAGLMAAGLLSAASAKQLDVDPAPPADAKATVELLTLLSVNLGIVESARVGRIFAASKEAVGATDAQTFAKDAAASIAGGPASSVPSLNLVAGGGARV